MTVLADLLTVVCAVLAAFAVGAVVDFHFHDGRPTLGILSLLVGSAAILLGLYVGLHG